MKGYDHVPTRHDTDVVGSRIVAAIIDTVVGFVIMFGTIMLFGGMGAASAPQSPGAAAGIAGMGILLGFVVVLAYFFLLEGLWDGYTIGKKVMGIKVVKENGQPCTLGASVIRNLLRIIDGFFYYVVGFIFMASSDRRQRLGDRLGGTVVVTDTPHAAPQGAPAGGPQQPPQGQQRQARGHQGQPQPGHGGHQQGGARGQPQQGVQGQRRQGGPGHQQQGGQGQRRQGGPGHHQQGGQGQPRQGGQQDRNNRR